jgi:hypothetical protein
VRKEERIEGRKEERIEISGSHGGEIEDDSLLGYCAV